MRVNRKIAIYIHDCNEADFLQRAVKEAMFFGEPTERNVGEQIDAWQTELIWRMEQGGETLTVFMYHMKD